MRERKKDGKMKEYEGKEQNKKKEEEEEDD
jgi:hypothetical protein